MFYTGQKVVCVRDDWVSPDELAAAGDISWVEFPKLDEIYTVRDKVWCEHFKRINIGLFEIRSGGGVAFGVTIIEARWAASYFRPLCSRPTSIEIFKRAPKPAPARIRIETVKERV